MATPPRFRHLYLVVGNIGDDEESGQEVTRALARDPSDPSGPSDEPHPADAEGPTRMVVEEALALAASSIASEPPPQDRTQALARPALIGEEDVPITEGTALMPGTKLRAHPSLLGGSEGIERLIAETLPAAPAAPVATSVVVAVAVAPRAEETIVLSKPPTPTGWGRAIVIFVLAFVVTGAALLYAWHRYLR